MIFTTFLLIIGLIWLGYILILYRLRKNYEWHKKTYESLGYKVKVYDVKLLNLGLLPIMIQNFKQHADPQYIMKKEYLNYDIVLLSFFLKIQVIFIKPELIKHFLGPESYYKYPKYNFTVSNLIRVFGGGILFSDGDIWKRKRKVITKVFNHELLVANISKISSICDEVMQKSEQCIQDPISGKKNLVTLNIGTNFKETFSTVILRCFFGKDLKNQKINGQDISTFTIRLAGDVLIQTRFIRGLLFGSWVYDLGLTAIDRDINKRKRIIKSLAKQFIEQRLEELKKNKLTQKSSDIIEALYKYQQSQNNSEESYNFNQLIDQFLTFFVAGTDTTANLTRTMLYHVALNSQIEKRLRQEIQKCIEKQEDITWENLKKLTYIDWLQNETIRIYGPLNTILLRESIVDNLVLNVPVKKGDIAAYLSTPNHYNPEYFTNPQQFRPQRWEKQCDNIDSFALLGFSSGPRTCIGRSLALLQNKIAIVKFMRRYKSIKLDKKKIEYEIVLLVEASQIKTILQKAN